MALPKNVLDSYNYALNRVREIHNGDERTPEEYRFNVSEDKIFDRFEEYMADEGYTEEEIEKYWNSSEIQSNLMIDLNNY